MNAKTLGEHFAQPTSTDPVSPDAALAHAQKNVLEGRAPTQQQTPSEAELTEPYKGNSGGA